MKREAEDELLDVPGVEGMAEEGEPDAEPDAGSDSEPASAPPAQSSPVRSGPVRSGPVKKHPDIGRPGGGALSWLRIREEIPLWSAILLGMIPITAVIGLWAFVTSGATPEARILSPTILPSPVEVVGSFPKLWFERALTRNVFISFRRVALGFLVGTAVAFPLGLLMGSFTKIRAMFNPLAVFGAYLPIPALVPLTMSLFGVDEGQKIAFLAMAFVIYLLPLIVTAVEDVDDVYLKTAYTLGANRRQVVSKVLLGVSWPDIFQSLRFGFGIGWSYIILVEMVAIAGGVGAIIITSQRIGPREHIYLVLVVIVVIAFLTDRLWAALGRVLFPYRQASR